MELTTSESVTRFLRAKTTKTSEVITTSNQLLDGEIDVYFPGKELFVFELVCDRLNDPKNKAFRLEPQFWDLFQDLWLRLQSDATSRYRVFKKIKFLELVSLAYSDMVSDNISLEASVKLLSSTIRSSLCVMKDSFVEIDENIFIAIFANYLKTIYGLLTSDFNDWELVIEWNLHMNKLFHLSNLNYLKYNKKTTSKFTTDCLATLLNVVILQKNAATDLLDSIMNKVIFTRESIVNLKFNTDLLVKDKSAKIESLNYFFSSSIKPLSKSDIKTCEEIFICITASYPNTSELLLSNLSQANRTLSMDFLTSIMEREINSASQNWGMISHLIDLDVDIALTYSERIFSMVAAQKYESSYMIGEKLAEAYIRAREFTKFFSIWRDSIKLNESLWGSQDFSIIISSKVHNFSPNQIATLVNDLVKEIKDESYLILLSSIVQGLFICQPVTKKVAEKCFKPIFETKQEGHYIWKLRYQLLCLYPDFFEFSENLIEIGTKSNDSSEFLYYTMFRIRETRVFEITSLCSKFVKLIKKRHELLYTVFNRWLVLINNVFEREDTISLIKILFEQEIVSNKILKNENFYEQKNLTDAAISLIIDSLKAAKNILSTLNVIKSIPNQCFSRHSKDELLDIVYKIAIEDKGDSIASNSRQVLYHLLVQPTFRSTIEMDHKAIGILLSSSDKYKAEAIQIFDLLWTHHLQQYNEKLNKKYIKKLLSQLEKYFEKKKFKRVDPPFEIALTILTNKSSAAVIKEIPKLLEDFISAVNKLLRRHIKAQTNEDYSEVSWLLDCLYNVHSVTPSNVEETYNIVKNVGASSSQISNERIKVNLFKLLTQTAKLDTNSSYHMMALYIVVRGQFSDSSDSMLISLKGYLSRLPEETFTDSYHLLLYSIKTTDDSIEHMIEILVYFMRTVKREYSLSQDLFAKSLAVILSKYDSIKASRSIERVLGTLKVNLTEISWCFTQYSFELTLTLLTKIAYSLNNEENTINVIEIYTLATHVMSHIILFHRLRLSNRNHLVISLFKSLMECLTLKKKEEPSPIASSKECAAAFARLLSNLCEPQNSNAKETDSLTSSSSVIKRALRKHLPILLTNYVYLSLRYVFQSEIRAEMLPGIFTIFDVLSQPELLLVSSSLDLPGKTYYKTLYDEYKKFGKWKDE